MDIPDKLQLRKPTPLGEQQATVEKELPTPEPVVVEEPVKQEVPEPVVEVLPAQTKRTGKEIAQTQIIPAALKPTIETIKKKYGDGTIFAGLDNNHTARVEFISSGNISLDTILGGGYGRARLVEIFGPESSGKTTLALHAIASAQKTFPNLACAFVDAEHALDREYARALGVNLSTLLLSQPDYGEQGLEIVDMLVRSGGCSLIVVDSVAALVPRAELEGEMGDSHMGLQARLMSQAMRKLTGTIMHSNTTVIFINQMRMKIGVSWGNPETTTGGNALKFYTSQRIDIRRIGQEKDKEEVVGNKTRIKIVKNKLASPFREAELVITYGKGLNRSYELLDLGAKYGIVDKSGAWYSYNKERVGQGRNNAADFLDKNKEMADEIEQKIRQKIKERGNVL